MGSIIIIQDGEPPGAMITKRSKTEKTAPQVWIGLVHVRPAPGSDPFGEGQKGAYVNAAVLTESAENFIPLVEEALREDALIVIEVEDLLRETQYRDEGRINVELDSIIRSLNTGHPVGLDDFHVYRDDDA